MGREALQGPQKLFLRWTWEDWGPCFLCFSNLPKGLVCWGLWRIGWGGTTESRERRRRGQSGDAGRAGVRGRGRCVPGPTGDLGMGRTQVKGSCGSSRARVTSCEGSRAGSSRGRGASLWGLTAQGRRTRGRQGRTLGCAACRTCRRGWRPSSQPAVAAHYGTRRGPCGQKEAALRPGGQTRGGCIQWRGVAGDGGVSVPARLGARTGLCQVPAPLGDTGSRLGSLSPAPALARGRW